MSLIKKVEEEHVVTETPGGLCCFTCSSAAAETVTYPCPTLQRAYELENISPTGA
jgi:hypothetical protein